jgi:hypothetical protein
MLAEYQTNIRRQRQTTERGGANQRASGRTASRFNSGRPHIKYFKNNIHWHDLAGFGWIWLDLAGLAGLSIRLLSVKSWRGAAGRPAGLCLVSS